MLQSALASCSLQVSEKNQIDFIVSNTSVQITDVAHVIGSEYDGYLNGDFYSTICVQTGGLTKNQVGDWESGPHLEFIQKDIYLFVAFNDCFPDNTTLKELISFVRSVKHVGSSIDSLDIYVYDGASGRLFNGAFQN